MTRDERARARLVEIVLTSPSGRHVKVLCPCGREHWTGNEQDAMCHNCGRVLRADAYVHGWHIGSIPA